MVLRLVGRGRVGRCQPFPYGGGGVDPSGLMPPPPFFVCVVGLCLGGGLPPKIFLFYQPEPGAVVGKERTNYLGTFAHAATHLPNTLMAWTKVQASAESYLKL